MRADEHELRQVGQYKDNRGWQACMNLFTWLISLDKTEPPWLSFQIFGPNQPRVPHQIATTPSSNPMYPTWMGSPIPKKQPTCISLAQTKPQQLGFWIFGPNQPPFSASLNYTLLPPQTDVLQPNCIPTTQNPVHPHLVSQNQALAAWILAFGLISPTLMRHPIATPYHINSMSPTPVGYPSTQKPAHVPFSSKNWAPAAQFLAFCLPPLHVSLNHIPRACKCKPAHMTEQCIQMRVGKEEGWANMNESWWCHTRKWFHSRMW